MTTQPAQVILDGMTHKVGPKGQVVIPKDLRVELGIEPGDEVTFRRDGDEVVVQRSTPSTELKGRFRDRPLTGVLERDRDDERRRDARR